MYNSKFTVSDYVHELLLKGRIIDFNESAAQMNTRIVNELFSIESIAFNTSLRNVEILKKKFGNYLDNGDCILNTSIMTNAGRYADKPLSSVTVPLLNSKASKDAQKKIINNYHQHAMGTGFNLNNKKDPVKFLRFINDVAVEGANSGMEDRPVGNMAILSVHHPRVLEFISSKVYSHMRGEQWKFNISVDISSEFMDAYRKGLTYTLTNGKKLNAIDVLSEIADCAWKCADPGVVFMHRMNSDNPTPSTGEYISTAPCGDVGLAVGESCEFGYINLSNYVKEDKTIDLKHLRDVTRLLTRVLDNSLEISLGRYAHPINRQVMKNKRKLGIGICGVADILLKLHLPYDCIESRMLIQNLMIFINYESKMSSIKLGEERESFGAMSMVRGNRYLLNNNFLIMKYGKLSNKLITPKMWKNMSLEIRNTKKLRNASTTAVPPTGRSALIIGASAGIEPLFSLINPDGSLNKQLLLDFEILLREKILTRKQVDKAKRIIAKTGRVTQIDWLPRKIKEVYKTALDISPIDHLLMAAEIQFGVDEAVSKTVNLPSRATSKDVLQLYVDAFKLGMKGVTIYREGIAINQPIKLSK